MNNKELQIKAEKYIEENGIDKNTYAIEKAFRDGAKMILNLNIPVVSICVCGTEEHQEENPREDNLTYCSKCDKPYQRILMLMSAVKASF